MKRGLAYIFKKKKKKKKKKSDKGYSQTGNEQEKKRGAGWNGSGDGRYVQTALEGDAYLSMNNSFICISLFCVKSS